MNSRELLYVKTVAEEKNISKAAKRLFIAQPSLSQSIQRIEEAVGTPLFNRTASGLTLTFAGERYYHMASKILKIYEDFELEISDINNLKTGRIHLGITNHLGTLTLPEILPRFCDICSHIELNISEETSARLEQMLLSGELDFAIMHTPPLQESQPQLLYEPIQRDPFVVALAPGHPLIAQAKEVKGYPYPVIDIRLLKHETFLMLHREQRIRQITDSVLAKAQITQPQIRLTLRNFETVQMLAAQGLGVTLIPLEYSQIASSQYRPVLLSIDQKYGAWWELCIARMKNGFLSKADQLFLRILQENYKPKLPC